MQVWKNKLFNLMMRTKRQIGCFNDDLIRLDDHASLIKDAIPELLYGQIIATKSFVIA